MEELGKETVIIVHGTWAAPKSLAPSWYLPVNDGAPLQKGFVVKLNDELDKRGSLARCWAHCAEGDQIFYWSGENDWVARTSAAQALRDYVMKLQNEGWCCHIVAHSHGGNIVAEAFSEGGTAQSFAGRPLGRVVTLGTPFIDILGLVNIVQ
jgi:hypothetical protein